MSSMELLNLSAMVLYLSAFPVSGNGTGLRAVFLCTALQDHIPAQSAEAPKCGFPAYVKWLIIYKETMVQHYLAPPRNFNSCSLFLFRGNGQRRDFSPFVCASVTRSSSVVISDYSKVWCGSPDATTRARCAHMGIAAWDQAASISCFYLLTCKIPQTKVGGPRKYWSDWAHLVLQGLLQIGPPATHTGSWSTTGCCGKVCLAVQLQESLARGGIGSCLGSWKHFQISLESILSFKASNFSCRVWWFLLWGFSQWDCIPCWTMSSGL